MYEHLRGTLCAKTPAAAVVEAAGVGFSLAIPLSTFERLPEEGREVRLFTEFVVREDSHRLYGFATREERGFFRALQSVSGVGPAVALGIVSSVPFAEFRAAVLGGDAARLRQVRGIGRKLSERLVVELKDEMRSLATAGEPGPAGSAEAGVRDAVLALEALGFPRASAEAAARAAAAAEPEVAEPGELVRLALRRL